jgi:hypothetical protein
MTAARRKIKNTFLIEYFNRYDFIIYTKKRPMMKNITTGCKADVFYADFTDLPISGIPAFCCCSDVKGGCG